MTPKHYTFTIFGKFSHEIANQSLLQYLAVTFKTETSMSFPASEITTVGSAFEFDGMAIDEMVASTRTQITGGVASRELALMNVDNVPLVGAYHRLVDGESNIAQATGLGMGYLVGWQALRMTGVIVPVSENRLLAFETRYEDEPAAVDADFEQDYAGHVAVLTLVHHTLQNPAAQMGAKLVFNYHGDQANQTRPPRDLPEPRRKHQATFEDRTQQTEQGGAEVSIARIQAHPPALKSRQRHIRALGGQRRFGIT